MKRLSPLQCKEFKDNPAKNPLTKRSISPTGALAKTLKKQCAHEAPRAEPAKKTHAAPKKKNELSAEDCKQFLLNDSINPLTGRKIQKHKGVWNELSSKCKESTQTLIANNSSRHSVNGSPSGGKPAVSLKPKQFSTFVAKGGEGCVFSPAIVFSNSREITPVTRDSYVTKLTESPGEFKKAKDIERALGSEALSVGVFPVDEEIIDVQKDIFDDVTLKSMDANCQKDLSKIIFSYEYSNKRKYAVQFKRYWGDLNTQIFPFMVAERIMEQLEEKLEILHRCGIAHMDIKKGNLCLLKGYTDTKDTVQARFSDWGFAENDLFDPRLSYENAKVIVNNILLNEYYYFKVLLGKIALPEIIKYKNLCVASKTLEECLRCIFTFDRLCLCEVKRKLWNMSDEMFGKYIRDILVKWRYSNPTEYFQSQKP